MTDQPSRLARLIDRTAPIGQLLQNLAVVVGIIATGGSFLASIHDKRVQNVLSLRTEFASGAHGDYLKLLSDWHNSSADAFDGAEDAKRREIVRHFFTKNENENQDRLQNIADFYDTLAACIEQGSCDRDTAVYLFYTPADHVIQISGFRIEDVRNNPSYSDFAVGVEKMYRSKE
jgi:hypothetical protein